jgi:hypothetical protein
MVFRRSSFSGAGNCVEVADHEGVVLVRNSRHPQRVLAFPQARWQAFLAGVKNGDLDALSPLRRGSA